MEGVTLWKKIMKVIIQIFGEEHCRRRGRLGLKFSLPELKTKKGTMTEVAVTNEQKIKLTLNPVTLKGKPAQLDGPPKWSVISGDSRVEPADDGLSAYLVSSDTPGDTTFLIDADADLGAGVEDVQETITLHVAGARAANLGVIVGTPELK